MTLADVRTVCEDLPFAPQQAAFVLKVKGNPFMVVSIVFGVLCSIKAVYDALQRTTVAVGAAIKQHQVYLEEQRLQKEEKQRCDEE